MVEEGVNEGKRVQGVNFTFLEAAERRKGMQFGFDASSVALALSVILAKICFVFFLQNFRNVHISHF